MEWLALTGMGAFAKAAWVAAFAACGYLCKSIIEAVQRSRNKGRKKLSSLLRLSSLLAASRTAFTIQIELRDRLFAQIVERRPDYRNSPLGFEEIFSRMYAEFTPGERELHGIIRGISMYALRPINLRLSQWIAKDTEFRTAADSKDRELAQNLNMLASHLLLWHAKYRAWIPRLEQHALVYMADEDRHGLPFPKDTESALSSAIARRRRA